MVGHCSPRRLKANGFASNYDKALVGASSRPLGIYYHFDALSAPTVTLIGEIMMPLSMCRRQKYNEQSSTSLFILFLTGYL